MKSVINKFVMGSAAVALILPSVALAADAESVLTTVSKIIGMVVPILISLAIVLFLWGLLMYMTKAGEEKAKAREQMLWGIIAIAVMVSIWGLVGILRNTFDVTENDPTNLIPKTVEVNQQGSTNTNDLNRTRN